MVSWYRHEHPLDVEDKGNVGFLSEDEAEGLDPGAGVAWRGQAARGGPPQGATPTAVGECEVVVKKWVLKRMKQQVSALL